MKQVSSANVVYFKYAWLIGAILCNTLVFLFKGGVPTWGSLFLANMSSLGTLGIVSVYALRLWDVSVDGTTVVVYRNNTSFEFDIREIKKIELIPNLISKGMPPFVNIILQKPVSGVQEFKFLPAKQRLDEPYLIQPWKELYRAQVQDSLRKRRARR